MPYGSVLVVDDLETNIYVAKGLLCPYGLKIESAGSGLEAIEKISAGKTYDIIFMDHMMPIMDGLTATKIIRDLGYEGQIVALTADVVIGREKMFLSNGFDGFISKPIDSLELNNLLNSLIRDKQPALVIEAARREQKEQKRGETEKAPEPPAAYFVHDADKALKTLQAFLKKLPDPGEKEIELFIITAHGIKNALNNIGQADLSGQALKLERAGANYDMDFIARETPPFMETLESLIKTFRAALYIDQPTELIQNEVHPVKAYLA